MDDIAALAKEFFDSVERGDVAKLQAIYAPEAKIWHNTDELEQTVAENLDTLRGFVARIADRRYENRRLSAFPGGFVQQHRLTGKRVHDGKPVSLTACIVCKVEHGRITRLDEYFNSAAVARFREA